MSHYLTFNGNQIIYNNSYVITNLTATGSSLLTNLLAYYKFDATTGTNMHEEIHNYDGTAANVSVGAVGILNTTVQWNSSAGYVNIPGSVIYKNVLNDKVSISLWLKPDILPSVSTYAMYLLNFHRGSDNPITLIYSTDNRLYFYTEASPPTYNEFVMSTPLIDISSWSHIVCVCGGIGTDNSIYINGISAWADSNTLISPIDISVGNTSNDCIGAASPTAGIESMLGKIDEIGIWNKALTPTEVSALYNGGAGNTYPFESSLGYYDDFTAYTGGISGKGPWVMGTEYDISINITANPPLHYVQPSRTFQPICAYVNKGFSNNHSAELTIKGSAAYIDVGPAVRISGETMTCYAYYGAIAPETRGIEVYMGGVWYREIAGAPGYTVGDVLKLTIDGSKLTCYRNGKVDASMGAANAPAIGSGGIYYDSSLTTGQPGISTYDSGASYATYFRAANI